MKTKNVTFLAAVLALVVPAAAQANVVWPGLLLARGMVSWAIPVGLAVEAVILRRWLRFAWPKSLGVATLANVVSAIVGAAVVATLGYGWEMTPMAQSLYAALHWGTFNPLTWIGTCAAAAVTSTVVELLVLRRWWPEEGSTRGAFLFFAANVVTTAVALFSVSL